MGLQNKYEPPIASDMEKATQSSRPDARIIRLCTPETPTKAKLQRELQIPIIEVYTLTYLDQLLDEHFK